ncbi:MAG TPA: hypothetical protein VN711_04790 [Candidatus Saccharimonadales bacterium]|nr:hypothetical protein [Candidatus Saccharimonadales bacterium]
MKPIKSLTFFDSCIGDLGNPNFNDAQMIGEEVDKMGVVVIDGRGTGVMSAVVAWVLVGLIGLFTNLAFIVIITNGGYSYNI